MDMYEIHLESTMFRFESNMRVPETLEHWTPLVRHYAARCNRFRADCWPQDAAALSMFQPYVEMASPWGASPAFVVGRLTPELLDAILADPFDASGAVKWFSLFLLQDDTIIMSSAHNAAEIHLSEVTGEELAWIQSILPEDVHLSSWTKEELARLRADQPVTGQGIDVVCPPATGDGADLNALGMALAESLASALAKAFAPTAEDTPGD